ncbi:MAG: hypothetical protein WBM24_07305 [Candidatus Sulfotelmatobacter sp.]
MNDGWTTTNRFLASTVHMVYGHESMTGIELRPVPNSRNEPEYQFNIGSCDGNILAEDYENGQLSITDVKSFAASYVRITGQLKKMHQSKDTSWRSSAWYNGKTSDGRKIK